MKFQLLFLQIFFLSPPPHSCENSNYIYIRLLEALIQLINAFPILFNWSFLLSFQIVSITVSSSLLIFFCVMHNLILASIFLSQTQSFHIQKDYLGPLLFFISLLNFLSIWNKVMITVLIFLTANSDICVILGQFELIFLLIVGCIFLCSCIGWKTL